MSTDHIHCRIRHRLFQRTPEEQVRQAVLTHLIDTLCYPAGRFSVENTVMVHGVKRRTDILLHDEYGSPLMIIECKAPHVQLDQKTISQISNYNFALRAPYLMLSNGADNHLFHIDIEKKTIDPLKSIPAYDDL